MSEFIVCTYPVVKQHTSTTSATNVSITPVIAYFMGLSEGIISINHAGIASFTMHFDDFACAQQITKELPPIKHYKEKIPGEDHATYTFKFYACLLPSPFDEHTLPDDLQMYWLRGFFESFATVKVDGLNSSICFQAKEWEVVNDLHTFIQLPGTITSDDWLSSGKGKSYLTYTGWSMWDLIQKVYPAPTSLCTKRVYDACQLLLGFHFKPRELSVHYVDKRAVSIYKTRFSDASYNCYVIAVKETLSDTIVIYDTGLQIRAPYGYYLEMIAHESLIGAGYVLSTAIAIINPSHQNNVAVMLTKIDTHNPNLSLPFCAVRLILRRLEHFAVKETYEEKA